MADGVMDIGSVAKASLAAGLLFFIGLALASLVLDPAQAIPLTTSGRDLMMIAFLVPVVTIVGAVIAFLPNLLGTFVLTRVGGSLAALRGRVAWAVTGAVAAGGPAMIVANSVTDGDWTAPITLGFTGMCCAIISRAGVRWNDSAASPLSEPRSPAICTRHET